MSDFKNVQKRWEIPCHKGGWPRMSGLRDGGPNILPRASSSDLASASACLALGARNLQQCSAQFCIQAVEDAKNVGSAAWYMILAGNGGKGWRRKRMNWNPCFAGTCELAAGTCEIAGWALYISPAARSRACVCFYLCVFFWRSELALGISDTVSPL